MKKQEVSDISENGMAHCMELLTDSYIIIVVHQSYKTTFKVAIATYFMLVLF